MGADSMVTREGEREGYYKGEDEVGKGRALVGAIYRNEGGG